MSEGDVVMAHISPIFQQDQSDPKKLLKIEGYVYKMTAPQYWANQPANRSVNSQGI
jgi:hypothetical protein